MPQADQVRVITFSHAAGDALILLAFIGCARRHLRFSGENSEERGYLPDMIEGSNEIQENKKPSRSMIGEQKTECKTESKKRDKIGMSWD